MEDQKLEQEHKRLTSIEKLRLAVQEACERVSCPEGGALEGAGRALGLIGEAARTDPALEKVEQALVAAQSELQEVSHALDRYQRGLEADPKRLQDVDDRLDALKRLGRKHGTTLEGVIARRAALASELDVLERRSEIRARVEADLAAARAIATQRATELSKARARAAQKLEKDVSSRLGDLALGSARFSVQLEPAPLSSRGADAIELFFTANPGEPLRPLAKVASGGEASRVMLALRSALADHAESRCFVLDEADAGVGGAVADVVGRLIRELATHRQVLCITHLPQVAAHASAHLKVLKEELKGRAVTRVISLREGADRSAELARMLSGMTVTKEAHRAAQALLRTVSSVERKKSSRAA
jgi:DNA repair protein RecN (Recombination protein N)